MPGLPGRPGRRPAGRRRRRRRAAAGRRRGRDLDAAWHRLSAALPAAGAAPLARPRPAPGGPGRSCAARSSPRWPSPSSSPEPAPPPPTTGCRSSTPSRSQPVSLHTADLVALPDLSAYGDVEVTGGDRACTQVADAAAAAAQTGLDVPAGGDAAARGHRRSRVPGGRRAERDVHLLRRPGRPGRRRGRRAAAPAARRAGRQPGPPGRPVPGVAEIWTQAAGVPALVVARAVAPTAFSSGVPFDDVRDYLLSLPGLPADLATQLRSLHRGRVDAAAARAGDLATTSPAEVDGAPATVLAPGTAAMSAVVWVDDGVVTAVAGVAERRRGAVRRPGPAVTVAADRDPRDGAATPRPPGRRAAAGAGGLVLRAAQAVRPADRPSTASPFRSAAARCSACSARTARARPRVIKMLLGLVRPDAGEVMLLGRPGHRPGRARPGRLPARAVPLPAVADRRPRCWRCTSGWPASGVPAAGAARVPGARRPGRPRRRPGRRLLQGHAAAARAGRRARRPAGARRPRRADQRAGPARPGRRPRPGARAEGPRASRCCSTRT